MTDVPLPLSQLHTLVQHRGVADASLAEMLGPGVLVGFLPQDDNEGWSFRTAFHAPVLPPDADGRGLSPHMQCWPLRKAGQSKSFQNVILVGRAASNDVVLPHSLVSKLHARLRLQPDGSVFVMDAQSSNGTFVNGDTLGGTERRLSDGDTVGFGSVVLAYFSRPSLLRLLATRRTLG